MINLTKGKKKRQHGVNSWGILLIRWVGRVSVNFRADFAS